MATLKDVADLAGVTVTTVSRMMNNRSRVSEKTCAKISKAMKELGYRPNEVARSLAKKTSSVIGLIVPSAKNYFFSSLIESVEHYASAGGCKLMLCISQNEPEKESDYFNMLMSNKVMGIILASSSEDLSDLIGLGANLVTIERTVSPLVPAAKMDNIQGGHLAAEHLFAKGCRHPVYISGVFDQDWVANKRFLGFRDGCRGLGMGDPATVEANSEQFMTMQYDELVGDMFRAYPETDGILASNDIIAAAVVRHCQRNGMAVPEKIKVVGYDDTSFATHFTPHLTTIHQPVEDLCRYAVECILKISAGQAVPSSAVFPVKLVERETT